MELEKFARQLRLMVLLTQNYTMTIEEVGQKLCMSRRTIYRYID
ncbi:MAG: HTH domain-containing protein, partial [Prevotellamassilia sp.]|nr:HTH domain-containing protein [Prevotellamassilia sp.]